MPNPRKCSREDCPPININAKNNVNCHGCRVQFHLPCFNVAVPAHQLLVIPNIVFICDECLTSGDISPKRKTANDATKTPKQTVLRQSTLTPGRLLGAPSHHDQLSKSEVVELQKLVQNLSNKIDVNTNSVASLKVSVDSMHGTVSTNQAQIDESLKKNDNDFSSVTKAIVKKLDKIGQKQSYAQALGASTSKQIVRNMPSDSSQQSSNISKQASTKAIVNKYKGHPLSSGTNEVATHNLGAPVVIPERQNRRQQNTSNQVHAVPAKPKFAKCVYISRLQNHITVEGLTQYLHTQIADLDESQMSIRMLVKKDQDVSDLSFISFCIACTESLYTKLGSPSFWPSHIKMREFVYEPKRPRNDNTNVNANEKSPSSIPASQSAPVELTPEQTKNVSGPPVQLVPAASETTEAMQQA